MQEHEMGMLVFSGTYPAYGTPETVLNLEDHPQATKSYGKNNL